jgi:hypothetical protein
MNLAVHHASPAPHDILSRLKQQNHLLTEVTPTPWSRQNNMNLAVYHKTLSLHI